MAAQGAREGEGLAKPASPVRVQPVTMTTRSNTSPTAFRRGRARLALAGVMALLAAAWVVHEAAPHWRPFLEVMTSPPPDALPVPVVGVKPTAIADTWEAPRSGGRKHQGVDIFAKRGTPVVAPVHGIVLFIGQDRLGGKVVRLLGPGRQVHYFAHLENLGPIRVREWLKPGDIIGFVGDTGNARGAPPHLHYGVYTMRGALNPHPLLRAGQRPPA